MAQWAAVIAAKPSHDRDGALEASRCCRITVLSPMELYKTISCELILGPHIFWFPLIVPEVYAFLYTSRRRGGQVASSDPV